MYVHVHVHVGVGHASGMSALLSRTCTCMYMYMRNTYMYNVHVHVHVNALIIHVQYTCTCMLGACIIFQVMQGTVHRLPRHYSAQLQNIVDSLLVKEVRFKHSESVITCNQCHCVVQKFYTHHVQPEVL